MTLPFGDGHVFVARGALYLQAYDYELIVGRWFVQLDGPKTIGRGVYRRRRIGKATQ